MFRLQEETDVFSASIGSTTLHVLNGSDWFLLRDGALILVRGADSAAFKDTLEAGDFQRAPPAALVKLPLLCFRWCCRATWLHTGSRNRKLRSLNIRTRPPASGPTHMALATSK